ncbi:MAG: hypothetical protein EXS35_18065 [Pedosphaera sp.]|nr:hypothetical protein [Pedosphaera sp.]
MKLALFSSVAGRTSPNLVSRQHPNLDFLPTVLVCPLKSGEPVTHVRTTLTWEGREYTVLCDLARPINRKALQSAGVVDEETSRRIVDTFLRLLALS